MANMRPTSCSPSPAPRVPPPPGPSDSRIPPSTRASSGSCVLLGLHFRLRQQLPYFKDRDHGEQTDEDEEQEKEQPDSPRVGRPVLPGRLEDSPRGRHEILRQAAHNNH